VAGARAPAAPAAPAAPDALPPGWAAAVDPAYNHTYYYNAATGERTWERPRGGAALGAAAPAAPRNAEARLAPPGSGLALPAGWAEARDPASGVPYFYNAATGAAARLRVRGQAESPPHVSGLTLRHWRADTMEATRASPGCWQGPRRRHLDAWPACRPVLMRPCACARARVGRRQGLPRRPAGLCDGAAARASWSHRTRRTCMRL